MVRENHTELVWIITLKILGYRKSYKVEKEERTVGFSYTNLYVDKIMQLQNKYTTCLVFKR